MVILECIKARMNKGLHPNLYYYRDSHHQEIDLIYKRANKLIPIEIKSAESFNPHWIKRLSYLHELAPNQVTKGYVVYAGEQEYAIDEFELLNYKRAHEIVTAAE